MHSAGSSASTGGTLHPDRGPEIHIVIQINPLSLHTHNKDLKLKTDYSAQFCFYSQISLDGTEPMSFCQSPSSAIGYRSIVEKYLIFLQNPFQSFKQSFPA